MLKMICDCCGEDAKLCGYDVRVDLLHNPQPKGHFSTSIDPTITCDPKKMRFLLCEHCYRKMGFPNIYEANETKELTFRIGSENPEA